MITAEILHEQITKHIGGEFKTEFNPGEYRHPETIVQRADNCWRGFLDRNVEIVYHDGGDVILLQENGEDHKNRTAFVWLSLSNNDHLDQILTILREFLEMKRYA